MVKLAFGSPRIVDRFNVHSLTNVQREQLRLAGRAASGEETIGGTLAEAEREEMVWECFRVSRADTGEPAYDAWILSDDSGSLFVADTTEARGVIMIQSGFLPGQQGVESTVELGWYEARKLAGYSEAFQILDSLNRQSARAPVRPTHLGSRARPSIWNGDQVGPRRVAPLAKRLVAAARPRLRSGAWCR